LYGGNASGKSNFCKALSFAKKFVVESTKPDSPIRVRPFRLNTESIASPSRFEFTLLIDQSVYEFCFSITRKRVLEEKLVEITSSSEKLFYHHHDRKITFGEILKNELKEDEFLNFVFKGTQENQLFLTNAISQRVGVFLPIYAWFRQTLQLVSPDAYPTRLEGFFDEKHPLHPKMNKALSQLDTAISSIGSEELPFENTSFPETWKDEFEEVLDEDEAIYLPGHGYSVGMKDGEVFAQKPIIYHPNENGEQEAFSIDDESDGTQQLMELLPTFFDLSKQSSTAVYIVDEIDRSLHPLLIRRLLEAYLGNCNKDSRSQLLLTTHDALLMDQNLLRRDEMWVAERNAAGASSLTAFSDYKDTRSDKDIRKSYLQGRIGGIPRIFLHDLSLNTEQSENTKTDDEAEKAQ